MSTRLLASISTNSLRLPNNVPIFTVQTLIASSFLLAFSVPALQREILGTLCPFKGCPGLRAIVFEITIILSWSGIFYSPHALADGNPKGVQPIQIFGRLPCHQSLVKQIFSLNKLRYQFHNINILQACQNLIFSTASNLMFILNYFFQNYCNT